MSSGVARPRPSVAPSRLLFGVPLVAVTAPRRHVSTCANGLRSRGIGGAVRSTQVDLGLFRRMSVSAAKPGLSLARTAAHLPGCRSALVTTQVHRTLANPAQLGGVSKSGDTAFRKAGLQLACSAGSLLALVPVDGAQERHPCDTVGLPATRHASHSEVAAVDSMARRCARCTRAAPSGALTVSRIIAAVFPRCKLALGVLKTRRSAPRQPADTSTTQRAARPSQCAEVPDVILLRRLHKRRNDWPWIMSSIFSTSWVSVSQ